MSSISQNHLESFIDSIESESSSRKKYISNLNDILQEIKDDTYKLTFMKVTIPELYAQYEGFFKSVFYKTIEYIKELEIKNSDINKKYIIFPLLTHLTSEITNQQTKAEKIIEVFNNAFYNNKNFLNISNIKNYVLNLNSTKHTMDILGIDSYKLPMQGLNLLYRRRCEIAHGVISDENPFYISPELDVTDYIVAETYRYWKDHYKCVIYAINIMATLFIDFISTEGYKIA